MADAPAPRPMKYPYTFSAKIAQFPFKFHAENQWLYKYLVFGCVATFPIIYKIHKMANSPENKKKWADKKLKESQEHH